MTDTTSARPANRRDPPSRRADLPTRRRRSHQIPPPNAPASTICRGPTSPRSAVTMSKPHLPAAAQLLSGDPTDCGREPDRRRRAGRSDHRPGNSRPAGHSPTIVHADEIPPIPTEPPILTRSTNSSPSLRANPARRPPACRTNMLPSMTAPLPPAPAGTGSVSHHRTAAPTELRAQRSA